MMRENECVARTNDMIAEPKTIKEMVIDQSKMICEIENILDLMKQFIGGNPGNSDCKTKDPENLYENLDLNGTRLWRCVETARMIADKLGV